MVLGNKKIEIIQGDSYRREISIEGVDQLLIEGVYFSCEGLKICRKLFFNGEAYILSFSPEETIVVENFNGNYDITVKFVDGNINTVQYRAAISIIPKNNKVTCYG